MSETIRILIIEDNPADAELAEYTLRSAGIEFVSKVVETRDEYVHALSDFSPDIIISDYDLPVFNGQDALDILREVRPDIPFILYTGAMGEERAIEILTGGATDYVMKSRLSRLAPAIDRALKETEERKRRQAAEAERDLLIKELEARVEERTAELRAEMAERRVKEEVVKRQADLLDLSYDAIFTWELDGAVEYWNRGAELLYGYPRHDALGRVSHELLCTQHPVSLDELKAALRRDGMWNGELRHTTRDGRIIIVETRQQLIPQDGRLLVLEINLDITDRKRAEEDLREALDQARSREEEMAALLDSVPALTFIAHDPEAGKMTSSRSALELLGLGPNTNTSLTAPEEERPTNFRALKDGREISPDELPVQRAARRGEEIRDYELTLEFKDGRSAVIYGNAVPIFDPYGKPRGAIGAFIDISERKRAEEELSKSEERFRSIFESDVAALFIWNANGQLIDANDRFLELIGHSREQFNSGKVRWDEATPPEMRDRDYEAVKELQAGREIEPYEKEFVRPDGARVPVLIGGKMLPGTPDVGVAFAIDISKRKEAERELEGQRKLLQHIINSIPVLLVMWNPRLKTFTLNRHAQSVLGWSNSDANDGDLMKKVYPDKVNCARVAKFMKSVKPGWHEWVITGKDGDKIPIDWSNVHLNDDTVIGIGVDLRERKAAEDALRRANDELEDKVRDRTALYKKANTSLLKEVEERRTTETKLRLVQKNLQNLTMEIIKAEEKARQNLATDLHDTVVQSLGAAKLRSQLIQDQIPERAKPVFAELQDLISESITQARSVMTEMSPPVLNDLGFSSALEWLMEQTKHKYGLDVVFKSMNGSTPPAHDVRVLLFQATRELLMNIVKHAQADTAIVKLYQSDQKIRIEVTDNGRGLDTNLIFQPNITGGFGLYSIRERLRHIGGVMAIRSTPGRGTTVLITAPREIGK